MSVRALDNNWDWVWDKGKQSFVSNSLEIAYDIKTRILCWYKDCFFDMQKGIDWKNYLGSKVSKDEIDSAIKKIVVTTDGVVDMPLFDSSFDGRSYVCSIHIKTIYGETIEVKI